MKEKKPNKLTGCYRSGLTSVKTPQTPPVFTVLWSADSSIRTVAGDGDT